MAAGSTQPSHPRRNADPLNPDNSKKRPRGLEESVGNKQQRTASPASPPPLPIHTLTVNIDGLDSGKWEQITKMPVFPQLDSIILTEHHLSAKFRPAYIVESGWDILMVAGPPKQGHLRHIDRGGVAILWKTSANWEVKQEIVSDHASHQSVHSPVRHVDNPVQTLPIPNTHYRSIYQPQRDRHRRFLPHPRATEQVPPTPHTCLHRRL